MVISKRHRVLIATDGSPSARAALATATLMPWHDSTLARVVVARTDWLRLAPVEARTALAESGEMVANAARDVLAVRWKDVDAIVLDEEPITAILDEAQRFEATLIVLGWRGHGTFRRLLAGSVSRGVAAQAACPVLVVRHTPKAARRFLVAFDGCPNAERAVDLLCSLQPPADSDVVLVNVLEPITMPRSASVISASARAHVRHAVSTLNEERLENAQSAIDAAVVRLERSGWSAKGEVRSGAPLERILSAASDHSADFLVLGARAVSGLERALLGSVANGALNRSSVPVLIVR